MDVCTCTQKRSCLYNAKLNINYQDFGTGEGMINLNKGSYHYRFVLNHQVLADIPFTVK
jgi:hypothetical protein